MSLCFPTAVVHDYKHPGLTSGYLISQVSSTPPRVTLDGRGDIAKLKIWDLVILLLKNIYIYWTQ
jgi:hypothetical protein